MIDYTYKELISMRDHFVEMVDAYSDLLDDIGEESTTEGEAIEKIAEMRRLYKKIHLFYDVFECIGGFMRIIDKGNETIARNFPQDKFPKNKKKRYKDDWLSWKNPNDLNASLRFKYFFVEFTKKLKEAASDNSFTSVD